MARDDNAQLDAQRSPNPSYHATMPSTPCRRHCSSTRVIGLLICITTFAAVLFHPGVVHADLNDEPLHLPSLRLGLGANFHPGQEQIAGFALDLSVGARLSLDPHRVHLGFIPEIGYSYSNGDDVGGHVFTAGLGFWITGNAFVGGTVFATFLVGRRAGETDVGLRAGLRGELLLGTLGLELAYELRGGWADTLHSVHLVFTIDIGPAVYLIMRIVDAIN